MKVDDPQTLLDERDVFDLSGPTHLLHPSACSEGEEKQALLAALVQAVYVAEKDRQLAKYGTSAQASMWWSQLGYEPVTFIHGDESEQIIGMVFKKIENNVYEDPEKQDTEEVQTEEDEQEKEAETVLVVAFRGTMLSQGESMPGDLVANMYLLLQQLHTTARYNIALQSIRAIVQQVGCKNTIIAGHSLGAALALLAGQTLASEGTCIETHLFNPPYPSPPLERIKSQRWKLALQLLRMASAATLSGLLLDSKSRAQVFSAFHALNCWLPHLYVNPKDPICSSYIGYFSSCDFMRRIGAGTLAQLAAPISLRGTIQHYLFGECKAFHLIPCAHLHVVKQTSGKLVKAHGLHQWWSPELETIRVQANLDPEKITEGVSNDLLQKMGELTIR